MDKMKIVGGTPLHGKIYVSGAKNAALPLFAATILSKEPQVITNVPNLADIKSMSSLLECLGVKLASEQYVKGDYKSLKYNFDASGINSVVAPYELVNKMRASVLVLGPLLARFGEAKVSLPGGCAIGTRPVDLHLDALEKMGAVIDLDGGYINAKTKNGRLQGANIIFPKVTVGGTENIMMAATLAEGRTVIANAAQEPEIQDLAYYLNKMGAKIEGAGTSKIIIDGVEELHSAEHSVISDRIEAATYAIAAAITRGKLDILNATISTLEAVATVLTDCGIMIEEIDNGFIVDAEDSIIMGTDIMTEPYPGFPTDVQAQMMALMATANGASLVTESIFENRFMHVPELMRMGADINIHGNASAIIRGKNRLSGAEVMATDLRASSSLILAALAGRGETIINRIYHLDRGYEKIEEKLSACGANIERIK